MTFTVSKRNVPLEAISQMLRDAMELAVANGANSVSIPDHLVEIAAWLAEVGTAGGCGACDGTGVIEGDLEFAWYGSPCIVCNGTGAP